MPKHKRQTNLQATIESEILCIISAGERLVSLRTKSETAFPLSDSVLENPGSIYFYPNEFRFIYRKEGYEYWVSYKKEGSTLNISFQRKIYKINPFSSSKSL